MNRAEHQARIREGEVLCMGGQLAEGERVFRDLLFEVRGRDRKAELSALHSLAVAYGMGGRNFEARMLAEAAAAVARELGDDKTLARCLGSLCGALFCLEVSEPMPRLLDEFRDAIQRLPEDERAPGTHEYCGSLLAHALLTRDLGAAVGHLARYEQTFPPEDVRDPTATAVLRALEARIHYFGGDQNAALAVLEKTEGLAISRPNIAVEVAVHWVEVLRAAGRDAPALERGHQALRLLEGLIDEPFTCYDRLEKGRKLAHYLDELGASEEAHRAYDIVAAAVLEHIAQLDACARSLPELGLAGDMQLQEVVNARKGYVAEQSQIMKRVAALLERDEGGVARVLAHEDDGFVRICAWCERLKPQDRGWLPLGQFVPRSGPLRITHGICPACAEALRV